jgi:DNA-binding Lrp family transcriptional regulator
MRDTDSKLISLLKANAREPTASLARKLGLATTLRRGSFRPS